jgi:hypothetical protein
MGKEQKETWDGPERRSGDDRRKNERRKSEEDKKAGVLSTRTGDRRREGRRAEDLSKSEEED